MSDELAFLRLPVELAAPRILGCLLVRELDGGKAVVRIVETEAYSQEDPASHSFRGPSKRSQVMFGPAGHLYVYFTYGMHYCCNIVTGEEGFGSGVLIRAVEPVEGEDLMRANRQVAKSVQLTNGPAKLCQALLIDREFNGHDLLSPPVQLVTGPALPSENIVTTTRIGISQAVDKPWRFYERDNPYVSVR